MTEYKMEELEEIVFERLGYRFENPHLLVEALTHRSFANEQSGFEDNQRLEFLGDAALGLVVAEALMKRLPDDTEGDMTPRRAVLVRESSLVDLARQIDMGDLLRLGRGEEMNNGRD